MHLQAFLPTSIHINNISYLLQSLDKQSFLYNFLQSSSHILPTYILALTILLQSLDRQSYFSTFSFYSSEDQFLANDYQLLFFIYIITIQLWVIVSNIFLVLYQMKKQFSIFRGFSRKKHLIQAKTKYIFCETKVL